MSEPPWSPIDSNKTKQSSEKSNTAGFINTLRKEFQPPDLRDVSVYQMQRRITCTVMTVQKTINVIYKIALIITLDY